MCSVYATYAKTFINIEPKNQIQQFVYYIIARNSVKLKKALREAAILNSILFYTVIAMRTIIDRNKKLSYCWETVRRESMPRIAEMDVKMTT